jgi:hypothetical protein
MNTFEILYFPKNQLTWAKACKLFKAGVARHPHAIEDFGTGRWLLVIDLGHPDELEASREDLMVLDVRGGENPKSWASLGALRTALRRTGYQGGLFVDFLSV